MFWLEKVLVGNFPRVAWEHIPGRAGVALLANRLFRLYLRKANATSYTKDWPKPELDPPNETNIKKVPYL